MISQLSFILNDSLRSGLINSKTFIRAIQFTGSVNFVAYGALQSVLSTEVSEADLKAMLQYTMTYSEDEKAEMVLAQQLLLQEVAEVEVEVVV